MIESRLKKAFSKAEIRGVVETFFPACDKMFDHSCELAASGFGAFEPVHEFFVSYCQTNDEVELLKRCQIEEAKERLFHGLLFDRGGLPYESAFLHELRKQRDVENSKQENQPQATELDSMERMLRNEYNPAARRLARESVSNHCLYEKKWKAARVEIDRIRGIEKDRLTQLPEIKSAPGDSNVLMIARRLTRAGLDSCGLIDVKVATRRNSVVVDLAENAGDILRWRFMVPNRLLQADKKTKPLKGSFDAALYVVNRDRIGTKERENEGNSTLIRYAVGIPGFTSAYSTYDSEAGFCLNLFAHTSLVCKWRKEFLARK